MVRIVDQEWYVHEVPWWVLQGAFWVEFVRFSKRQSFKKLPSSQPVSCPSFSVENHSLAKLSSQEKEQFLKWLQVIILLEYIHIYSNIYKWILWIFPKVCSEVHLAVLWSQAAYSQITVHHLLAVIWASYFTPLCLSFPIFIVEMTVVPTIQGWYEDEWVNISHELRRVPGM